MQIAFNIYKHIPCICMYYTEFYKVLHHARDLGLYPEMADKCNLNMVNVLHILHVCKSWGYIELKNSHSIALFSDSKWGHIVQQLTEDHALHALPCVLEAKS